MMTREGCIVDPFMAMLDGMEDAYDAMCGVDCLERPLPPAQRRGRQRGGRRSPPQRRNSRDIHAELRRFQEMRKQELQMLMQMEMEEAMLDEQNRMLDTSDEEDSSMDGEAMSITITPPGSEEPTGKQQRKVDRGPNSEWECFVQEFEEQYAMMTHYGEHHDAKRLLAEVKRIEAVEPSLAGAHEELLKRVKAKSSKDGKKFTRKGAREEEMSDEGTIESSDEEECENQQRVDRGPNSEYAFFLEEAEDEYEMRILQGRYADAESMLAEVKRFEKMEPGFAGVHKELVKRFKVIKARYSHLQQRAALVESEEEAEEHCGVPFIDESDVPNAEASPSTPIPPTTTNSSSSEAEKLRKRVAELEAQVQNLMAGSA